MFCFKWHVRFCECRLLTVGLKTVRDLKTYAIDENKKLYHRIMQQICVYFTDSISHTINQNCSIREFHFRMARSHYSKWVLDIEFSLQQVT